MPDINLATASPQNGRSAIFSKSLVISALAMVAVFVIYGGMLLYDSYIDSQIAETQSSYSGIVENLQGEKAKSVLDFYTRMSIAEISLNEERNVFENMSEIEKTMAPNSYLQGLAYKDDEYSLECVSDNYEIVAQQIFGFKGSAAFQKVIGGETSFDEENAKVISTVKIKTK